VVGVYIVRSARPWPRRALDRDVPSSVLGLLRQRRWVGFTLLAVFFVLLFARLSIWQVSRLHQREAANAVEQRALDAPPLVWAQVASRLPTEPDIATTDQYRQVAVVGHWDAAHQVLVRDRTLNGDSGYDVVTPIVPASGPALLVDRGWVGAGPTGEGPASVPAPQPGAVTVTARLQPSEPARSTAGTPAGQVHSINARQIGASLPYQVLDGYGAILSETPAPASAPQPQPDQVIDDGPHLSYAIQWVLFALIAICGWWTYLRREAAEAAALADESELLTAPPGTPAGSPQPGAVEDGRIADGDNEAASTR
jgi:cytochrome oxidase assembly protein ShyY1